jgi:hypothetical protein
MLLLGVGHMRCPLPALIRVRFRSVRRHIGIPLGLNVGGSGEVLQCFGSASFDGRVAVGRGLAEGRDCVFRTHTKWSLGL